MINKEVINLISKRTNINNLNLIEKDLILHMLLNKLIENKKFSDNYAFKGGTCLTKCYLGYYRFSEDLDFTYVNKKEFRDMPKKQIRRIISEKLNSLGKHIENIAKQLRLDFKLDKSNKRYFEFGAGNTFTTMKLWYVPENKTQETFIKIQINFLEEIIYSIKKREANPIFFGKLDRFREAFLLPQGYESILDVPLIKSYDIKEILIEKIRAILTRKGIKSRDFIDVFLIIKNKEITLQSLNKETIDKINFALKYEKYSVNLSEKDLSFVEDFKLGEEEKLMIKEFPEEFYKFLPELENFLIKIINEINHN